MSRLLRSAFLLPASVLLFCLLVIRPLPGLEFGWWGSGVLLVLAWLVWYRLWSTLQTRAAAEESEGLAAPMSSGELGAWIGLLFTLCILVYYASRLPDVVGPDGKLMPAAREVGRHVVMLIIAWQVLMSVLRRHRRDRVERDERDRRIHARACAWARMALVVMVVAVIVLLGFSPRGKLDWASPVAVANLLLFGLLGSSVLEYLVAGLGYRRDRRAA